MLGYIADALVSFSLGGFLFYRYGQKVATKLAAEKSALKTVAIDSKKLL
jgi:hypothetical protein